ncbi:hypothetical protein [Actinocorallia libanotica]|uniref:hypothetical protein n=1 Tax=Actinocorallia libanotica TaxID=46162 RepID=UPI0031CE6065
MTTGSSTSWAPAGVMVNGSSTSCGRPCAGDGDRLLGILLGAFCEGGDERLLNTLRAPCVGDGDRLLDLLLGGVLRGWR